MTQLIDNPIFGVLITLMAYEAGLYLQRRTGYALLNPLLISTVLIILFLVIWGIDYESYNAGGKIVSFFITPATVALAVPLYRNFKLLRANLWPIFLGITAGVLVNFISLYLLVEYTDLGKEMFYTLVPKSVTTPIGIELSQQIGGIPQITIAAIIISGLTGVILGPVIFRIFRISDKVARGIAYGTTSHALGTTKALEEGEIEGSMSGLSIGIAGLLTAVIVPLLLKLIL
ncbi:LrgB family protein [Proteiniclasticum sp. SCR006]|uniref:LrgB family protein n=1 Tax=Proteiniclasticum aestuarii TaxID=2817862 RepID=A0A939KEN0_9CLOT|nr:LrgB family protein [Proteiniclasticum aestuarii]MBO1263592.1 LrgB family protein [Proteiniclasticum aestuarii]